MTGKRRRGRDPLPPRPSSPYVQSPQPFVVARKPTRRELRQERRRQRRRRIGAAGIAGIVVLVIAIGVGIGFGVHKATTGHSGPQRTQQTLMLSLTGADGGAIATMLLAHDSNPNVQGLELLVPSRIITDVCGFGSLQFGHVLTLPDGQRLSRTALSDLLGGVTIDGSWVLTTQQLQRLVDGVGGVTVNVDTDVIARQPGGGGVLLVPKGNGQRLNGTRAVQFATYSPAGEDASGELSRFQEVVDDALGRLPADSSGVARLVSALGPTARSTLGLDGLAGFLVGVRGDIRSNNVLPTDLPVIKIDTGGTTPSYRIDVAATTQLVNGNLAASVPASARKARPRVFVQNGVGTPGLVDSACARLVRAGFAFAGSGNAAHFGYARSQVLVFDNSVATAELGNRVAAALRLPTSDVAVSSQGQNVADVVVILGKDYHP